MQEGSSKAPVRPEPGSSSASQQAAGGRTGPDRPRGLRSPRGDVRPSRAWREGTPRRPVWPHGSGTACPLPPPRPGQGSAAAPAVCWQAPCWGGVCPPEARRRGGLGATRKSVPPQEAGGAPRCNTQSRPHTAGGGGGCLGATLKPVPRGGCLRVKRPGPVRAGGDAARRGACPARAAGAPRRK